MTITPSFQGEIQFRRYSDTSTQGQQVVFAVQDREALAAFIGKEGKRFMAVLVELTDDDQPATQRKADVRGPLCREACDYCAMQDFWKWITTAHRCEVKTEQHAKDWLMGRCLLAKSRKELDEKPESAAIFINEVRMPFLRWKRNQTRQAAGFSAAQT